MNTQTSINPLVVLANVLSYLFARMSRTTGTDFADYCNAHTLVSNIYDAFPLPVSDDVLRYEVIVSNYDYHSANFGDLTEVNHSQYLTSYDEAIDWMNGRIDIDRHDRIHIYALALNESRVALPRLVWRTCVCEFIAHRFADGSSKWQVIERKCD